MNMTPQTLQVFDPAMCCSTGICGPDISPKLVQFAADLDWIKTQGVIVQRHNLSQNPAAFVENETVKTTLAQKGETALPLLLINGQIVAAGRYPERSELAAWCKLTDHEKPGDSRASSKPQASCCDSECSCHATGKPGKARWIIGVIVLAAAGVLAARGMIRSGGTASKKSAPAFASLSTVLTNGSGPATNSAATVPTTNAIVITSIGSVSELNTVAAHLDALFIFVPGNDATSALPPLTPMNDAARTIETREGIKCGLFTLKAGSPDYDQLAKQMALPCVLALVKGHGMSPVTGEITEATLVQGFVAASSSGCCSGASGSGCCQ
jgi:hypothetical protein